MAEFRLEGSVLRVQGSLAPQEDRELQDWCYRLMQTNEPTITVDLSGVASITSACIGVLSATWVDVITQDRIMDIIVSPEVRRIFTLAGFDKVLRLHDP